MVDMAAIGGLVSSLNAAMNIGKAAMELRDTAAIQTKLVDLNAQILAALSGAVDAKSAHLTMLDRIRALEQEIASLRAWDGEKQRYELQDVYLGSMAYVLKPSHAEGQPPHWLCANCYSKSRPSILQPQRSATIGTRWKCPDCDSWIHTNKDVSPASPFKPLFKS